MSDVDITVLGPLSARLRDGTEPDLAAGLRQLLAVLAAAGSIGLTQEQVADEVWGENLPASWESSFRNGLVRLRRSLGKEAIVTRSGRYALGAMVSVDAWKLTAQAESEGVPAESELIELLTGIPFVGIEASPLIRRTTDQIQASRTTLLQDFVAAGTSIRSGAVTRSVIHNHQRMNPFDEDLLAASVKALWSSGAPLQALMLLTEARDFLSGEGLSLSRNVQSLEREIRTERRADVAPTTDVPREPRVLPRLIAAATETSMVGRDIELTSTLKALSDRGAVLISGQSGVGKTRLLAAAGEALASEGVHVLYSRAQRLNSSPYSPLVAAVPGLADELAEISARTTDHKLAVTLSCAAISNALRSTSGDVCLMVDDVHRVDSVTEQALEYLALEALRGRFRVVLAGRSDAPTGDWSTFLSALEADGVSSLSLRPLTRDGLIQIAHQLHPDAGQRLCRQLASEVLKLSGGRPGAARFFMERAEAGTLLLEERMMQDDANPFRPFVKDMAQSTVSVAAAASVLGDSFDLAAVAELAEVTESVAVVACEELVGLGFFIEEPVLDRFSFVHTLHRSAVDESISNARRRRLHRRAARSAATPVEAARHLAAAVPLIPRSEAAVALLGAADELFVDGVWREAAVSYRDARYLDASAMTVLHRNQFAAALDLSGADGALVREESFRAAVAVGDWEAALSAAMSGLPHAEHIAGDRRRLELLQQVPQTELEDASRLELATAIMRQLTYLGDRKEAKIWSDKFADAATTPDEKLQAFINRALIEDSTDPQQPLQLPDCAASVADPNLALRAMQMVVLSGLEREDRTAARALVEKFGDQTLALGDPHRQWHFDVLRATLEFVDGSWNEAEQISRLTHDMGISVGAGEAESVRLAQLFGRGWLVGGYAELALSPELVERAGNNMVNHAMAAIIALDLGDDRRMHNLVSRIEPDILSSSSLFVIPTLVLLAPCIAEHASTSVVTSVRERLSSRSGTSTLVGNGALSAGPVDRALAALAQDESQRVHHLKAACELADRQGTLLWRIMCRRDLFQLGVADLATATDLASGSELQHLLFANSSSFP